MNRFFNSSAQLLAVLCLTFLLVDQAQARRRSCPLVLTGRIASQEPFLRSLDESADAQVNVGVLNRSAIKDTIELNKQQMNFRSTYLRYFKDQNYREYLTRSFEISLRARSELLTQSLKKTNDLRTEYDVVVVGAGVHGIIALHTILRKYPNAKVLIVDEGDTAGAVFRYGKSFFNINSSNRKSGVDTEPLPGLGNINELPGLPLQISDLTAVKYPTSDDLGSVLVAGLYSAIREYPNVDVLFGAKATRLTQPSNSRFSDAIEIALDDVKIQIDSQINLIATGLGRPRFPSEVKGYLEKNPDLLKPQSKGRLPKVVAFEDLVRILSSSKNPLELFKDLKVGVVGQGDSANVVIEFLLGYASREAYAESTAQTGRPEKIFWIGQPAVNCSDFVQSIRSRYAQIATGFRSSDQSIQPLLQGVPGRLTALAVQPRSGRLTATVTQDSTSSLKDLDIVIFTTGFESRVRDLAAGDFNATPDFYKTDKEFFDLHSTVVRKRTATSSQLTNVALRISGRPTMVIGTAAGELAAKEELVGIVQNFVSIYVNAPRVVAAVDAIELKRSFAIPVKLAQLVIGRATRKTTVTVEDVARTRLISGLSLEFLKTSFAEIVMASVSKTKSKMNQIEIRIRSGNRADDLEVLVDEGVVDLVNLLAQSREFFSVARVALENIPDKEIVLRVTELMGRPEFSISVTEVSSKGRPSQESEAIPNAGLQLRGVAVLKSSPAPTLGEVRNSQSLSTVSREIVPTEDPDQFVVRTGDGYSLVSISERKPQVLSSVKTTTAIDASDLIAVVGNKSRRQFLTLNRSRGVAQLILRDANFEPVMVEQSINPSINTAEDFQTKFDPKSKTGLIAMAGDGNSPAALIFFDLSSRTLKIRKVALAKERLLSAGSSAKIIDYDPSLGLYLVVTGQRVLAYDRSGKFVRSWNLPPETESLQRQIIAAQNGRALVLIEATGDSQVLEIDLSISGRDGVTNLTSVSGFTIDGIGLRYDDFIILGTLFENSNEYLIYDIERRELSSVRRGLVPLDFKEQEKSFKTKKGTAFFGRRQLQALFPD